MFQSEYVSIILTILQNILVHPKRFGAFNSVQIIPLSQLRVRHRIVQMIFHQAQQICKYNSFKSSLSFSAAHILSEVGVDYDFVDLNMGCPLDPIFRQVIDSYSLSIVEVGRLKIIVHCQALPFFQGAGSGLMCRANRLKSMVSGMSELLDTNGKPFTVKMRAGIYVLLYQYINCTNSMWMCKCSGYVRGELLNLRL